MIVLALSMLSACATRGLHDKYRGATEQRLVSRSIDRLAQALPATDFAPLSDEPVRMICHFLENSDTAAYAEARLAMALRETHGAALVDEADDARFRVHFFFSTIGTDQDSLGIKTPDFIIPGSPAPASFSILSLEMFHGIAELYYYIEDIEKRTLRRGGRIKQVVRTDRLALPLLSVPITTLD